MKYSRASYVSGNPQRAVLGCVDRDLIYTCAQTRACHYVFYEILLNPTYSTMSLQTKWPNFSSCLQYEHSCFILNLLASVTVIPILALGVNHFRISCSAFSLEKNHFSWTGIQSYGWNELKIQNFAHLPLLSCKTKAIVFSSSSD